MFTSAINIYPDTKEYQQHLEKLSIIWKVEGKITNKILKNTIILNKYSIDYFCFTLCFNKLIYQPTAFNVIWN